MKFEVIAVYRKCYAGAETMEVPSVCQLLLLIALPAPNVVAVLSVLLTVRS